MANTWDDILTDRDKEVFALSGYGAKAGFGQRPAVLIIDVNYNFVGDRREPIIESVKRFRNSCGEEGWVGVDHIVTLLEEARKKHLPIFFTTGHGEEGSVAFGRWHGKNSRSTEDFTELAKKGNEIVAEIAPQKGEVVVRKQKPSAFFGTPLTSMLERSARGLPAGGRDHHQRLRQGVGHRRVLVQLQRQRGGGVHLRPRPVVPQDQPLRHEHEVRGRGVVGGDGRLHQGPAGQPLRPGAVGGQTRCCRIYCRQEAKADAGA